MIFHTKLKYIFNMYKYFGIAASLSFFTNFNLYYNPIAAFPPIFVIERP